MNPQLIIRNPKIIPFSKSDDYTAIASAGITWNDSVGWASSAWTWGGNEIVRNIQRPSLSVQSNIPSISR